MIAEDNEADTERLSRELAMRHILEYTFGPPPKHMSAEARAEEELLQSKRRDQFWAVLFAVDDGVIDREDAFDALSVFFDLEFDGIGIGYIRHAPHFSADIPDSHSAVTSRLAAQDRQYLEVLARKRSRPGLDDLDGGPDESENSRGR